MQKYIVLEYIVIYFAQLSCDVFVCFYYFVIINIIFYYFYYYFD